MSKAYDDIKNNTPLEIQVEVLKDITCIQRDEIQKLENQIKQHKKFNTDVYLSKFSWYRKLRKGIWFKHQFTKDAEQLALTKRKSWWARYGKINRFSIVISKEIF